MIDADLYSARRPVFVRAYKRSRLLARIQKTRLFGSTMEPVEYLLCRHDRVAYIVNAKAACTSIQAELLRKEGIKIDSTSLDKGDAVYLAAKNNGFYSRSFPAGSDWFCFTFVRDPFARLASFYRNKVANAENRKKHRYINELFRSVTEFSDAVKIVAEVPDRMSNRHFKAQASLIFDEAERCDFIGKVENLSDDWACLSTRLGLTGVEALNNSGDGVELADMYTRESFDLTYQRFERDIKEFGYENEAAALGGRVYKTNEV